MRPTQDQYVHVMSSLVSVDRLQVTHVTHDVEFVTDPVPPMQVSRFPRDGECLLTTVAFDDRNVRRSAFTFVQQSPTRKPACRPRAISTCISASLR